MDPERGSASKPSATGQDRGGGDDDDENGYDEILHLLARTAPAGLGGSGGGVGGEE
jgi:hypothetical protein